MRRSTTTPARRTGLDKALTAVPADEVRDWLQVRFGQGLTGYPPPDDVLVLLKGAGENGKSTVIDGVRGAAARVRDTAARPGPAGPHRGPPDRADDAARRPAGVHGGVPRAGT